MSPATTAITGSLPPEKQGVASALNDTVREFGASIGIALIGSVLAAGYSSGIADTTDQLPDELAEPVGEGIGPALAVAGQLGEDGEALVVAARDAFLDGWGAAMTVATVVAVIAGAAAWGIFRSRPSDAPEPVEAERELVAA